MELHSLIWAAVGLSLMAIVAGVLGWLCNLFRLPANVWPRGPLGRTGPFGWLALIGAFLVFHAAALLVATIGRYLAQQRDPTLYSFELGLELQVWLSLAIALAILVILTLYTWILQAITRVNGFQWIWAQAPIWTSLGVGAASYLVAAPIAFAAGAIIASIVTAFVGPFPMQQVPVEIMRSLTSHPNLFVILALVNVLLIPLAEEWLFRGFLHTALRRYLNRHISLLLSAALFGLYHYSRSQGWANISVIGLIFVLGWFLGYVYERQRTLWAPYCLHACFNSISIVGIFVVEKYSIS